MLSPSISQRYESGVPSGSLAITEKVRLSPTLTNVTTFVGVTFSMTGRLFGFAVTENGSSRTKIAPAASLMRTAMLLVHAMVIIPCNRPDESKTRPFGISAAEAT